MAQLAIMSMLGPISIVATITAMRAMSTASAVHRIWHPCSAPFAVHLLTTVPEKLALDLPVQVLHSHGETVKKNTGLHAAEILTGCSSTTFLLERDASSPTHMKVLTDCNITLRTNNVTETPRLDGSGLVCMQLTLLGHRGSAFHAVQTHKDFPRYPGQENEEYRNHCLEDLRPHDHVLRVHMPQRHPHEELFEKHRGGLRNV